ncbi:MAG: UDP-N-acetylmuramoyl-L-alanine--D-glutamate ligase [bacterium]|nr:UDP-N-acetylmuramoyl-L-alanine--D-glutamate ligase [bacterium]
MSSMFDGKRVAVIGYGLSGRAAAEVLLEAGAEVNIADRRSQERLEIKTVSANPGIRFFTGDDQASALKDADLVVTSPGVPAGSPLLQTAVNMGLPVWSEVELACRICRAPIVAVTGTNGKTTTTTLIGELLHRTGRKTVVAGNIGLPLTEGMHGCPDEAWVVAEISSFQLEWVDEFRPRVALLLNLTPDHLDRHGTVEQYGEIKRRIFRRQGPDDTAILNADDPAVRAMGEGLNSRVLYFSRRNSLPEGACLENGRMIVRLDGRICDLGSPAEMKLRGGHNVENVLASVLAAAVCGLEEDILRQVVQSFPGVEHRLEPVAVIDGVEYINDSKGTNPDASGKAIEAMDKPFVLIAGGSDKGTDFTEFGRLIAGRAGYLVLIGETADRIEKSAAAAGYDRIYRAGTLEEAVRLSAGLAKPGEAVLLSPACASFDMFSNYEARGAAFKRAVLKEG